MSWTKQSMNATPQGVAVSDQGTGGEPSAVVKSSDAPEAMTPAGFTAGSVPLQPLNAAVGAAIYSNLK